MRLRNGIGPISLPMLVSLIVAGTALAAYLVSTVLVTVDVQESIEITSPTEINVALYPGESTEVTVTIVNHSSTAAAVSINGLVVPPEGVEVESLEVTVPGDNLPHNYEVEIEADSDAEPQEYTVTLSILRD